MKCTTRAPKRSKKISVEFDIRQRKAKIPEYENVYFDDNESTHSLDNEVGGFGVPIYVKKALT